MSDAVGCHLVNGVYKNTINTYSGKHADLLCPRAEDVDIESIAHSLSNTCRYGGHCKKFYSVAQHLLEAAELALGDHLDKDTCRAIFAHDFAEAYIGDMVKPLKIAMPEYTELEKKWDKIIEEKFSIDLEGNHKLIKEYDYSMYELERRAFFSFDKTEWGDLGDFSRFDIKLKAMGPTAAKKAFMSMALELGFTE